MRVPERRKPQLAGFDTVFPLLAVPVSITGIIVLITEVVIRLGVQSAVPSRLWGYADARNLPEWDFWKGMLLGVDLAAALWLNVKFHRQTGTYPPLVFRGGWLRRAFTGLVWLLTKSLFQGLMCFVALFLVVPILICLCGIGILIGEREPTFLQRTVSDAALLLGLSTTVIGLTAFSRSFWLWAALRHVELLPTAPGASPPLGLVEVRGTARAREENRPALALNVVGPFFVESEGRRIRVEPPEGFDLRAGQAYLPDDGEGGLILKSGEPVLAVGRLEQDGQGPVLRPCPAPRGSLIFTGRKRFFSIPNLFLIAHGDEAAAKRRLARTHLLWLGIASFLTIGGSLVALVGLAARLDPNFIRSLALGGGGL
jgi:hypothetical protein